MALPFLQPPPVLKKNTFVTESQALNQNYKDGRVDPTAPTPEQLGLDPEMLLRVKHWKMPFGRYKDTVLLDLPEPYLVWWAEKGFPNGELGRLMQLAFVIKSEGLLPLIRKLI